MLNVSVLHLFKVCEPYYYHFLILDDFEKARSKLAESEYKSDIHSASEKEEARGKKEATVCFFFS